MPTHIKYRITSTPTVPGSSSAKGVPLLNTEIDGNFKSLSNDTDAKADPNAPVFTGYVEFPSDQIDITTSNYPQVLPSLVMDFAKQESVDPRITFTRGSKGTRINSLGLVEVLSANEPRIGYDPVTLACKGLLVEDTGTNLLTNTENLTFAPNLVGSGLSSFFTAYPDTTIKAPNGVSGCTRFTTTAITSQGLFLRQSGITLPAGSLTVSAWVYVPTQTTSIVNWNLFFDAADIESANQQVSTTLNQWVRVQGTMTLAANRSFIDFNFRYNSGTVPSTAGIVFYVWGIQAESKPYVTQYMPSTDTFVSRASTATYVGSTGLIENAASGVARYSYNPNNLNIPPYLLLEEGRTNLLTHSANVSDVAWGKYGISVTDNATTSPDGTTSAEKITETAVTQEHILYYGNSVTNTTQTFSVFLKAAERWVAYLSFSNFVNYACQIQFDLNAGVMQVINGDSADYTGVTGRIENYGNGWWRCSITATKGQVNTTNNVALAIIGGAIGSTSSYLGVVNNGIYVWGAQLETGAFPTSYIPTTSSTVARAGESSSSTTFTRNADRVRLVGDNFHSWYNQREGTAFMGCEVSPNTGVYPRYFSISNGDYYHQIQMFHTPTPSIGAEILANGVVHYQVSVANPSPTAGSFCKMAFSYANARNRAFLNGASQAGIATNIPLPVVDRLTFDANDVIDRSINGHIAFFIYYPKSLSDSIIQEITSL